jgi:hypothetical protein
MNTNKQEITIDKFKPMILKVIVTVYQTSNSYGFVDIEIWIDGGRIAVTRGWRIIDASKELKNTFKLDAPAYPASGKWHKSIYFEPLIYKELSRCILPIFETCPDILTTQQLKEIDQKENSI